MSWTIAENDYKTTWSTNPIDKNHQIVLGCWNNETRRFIVFYYSVNIYLLFFKDISIENIV